MKFFVGTIIAVVVACCGLAMPLMLSSSSLWGTQKWDESEADWPGQAVDFAAAIPRATVIAVARLPEDWHDDDLLPHDSRYRLLDLNVKWYVKGKLERPSPAFVPARAPDGTPTTLPSPGEDRVVFFEPGPGSTPVVFKVSQTNPTHMNELRRQLIDEAPAASSPPTHAPASQPSEPPTSQASST